MRDPDAHHDEEESWLKDHKSLYEEEKQSQRPTRKQRKRQRKRRKKAPIRVSDRMRTCKHCEQEAARELFRKGKCLACQVADYLNKGPNGG